MLRASNSFSFMVSSAIFGIPRLVFGNLPKTFSNLESLPMILGDATREVI